MAKSGVITVAVIGTAVQGPDTGPGKYLIGADPQNTGYMYVGNDGAGDVTATNGYKLAASKWVLIETADLNTWWFDASVAGEKVTWIKVAPVYVNPSGSAPAN